MSIISINGVTITGNSKSVIISNGKIIIDGKDVTPDSKEINITVNGNIEQLKADSCNTITITGDVKTIQTQSGSVDVTGSINGSVSTMSGSVDCGGDIGGSVSTMSGNVKYKKA